METFLILLSVLILLWWFASLLSGYSSDGSQSAMTKEERHKKLVEEYASRPSDGWGEIGSETFSAWFDWDAYHRDMDRMVDQKTVLRKYREHIRFGGYLANDAEAREREALHHEVLAARAEKERERRAEERERARRAAVKNVSRKADQGIRSLFDSASALNAAGCDDLLELSRRVQTIISKAQDDCRTYGGDYSPDPNCLALMKALQNDLEERGRKAEVVNRWATGRVAEIVGELLENCSATSGQLSAGYDEARDVVARANRRHERLGTGCAIMSLPSLEDYDESSRLGTDPEGPRPLGREAEDALSRLSARFEDASRLEEKNRAQAKAEGAARAEAARRALAEQADARERVALALKERLAEDEAGEWRRWSSGALGRLAEELSSPERHERELVADALSTAMLILEDDRPKRLEEICRDAMEPLGYTGVTLRVLENRVFELAAALPPAGGSYCVAWVKPLGERGAKPAIEGCLVALKSYAQGTLDYVERLLSSHFTASDILVSRPMDGTPGVIVLRGFAEADGGRYGIACVFADGAAAVRSCRALAQRMIGEYRALEEDAEDVVWSGASLPLVFDGVSIDSYSRGVDGEAISQVLARALMSRRYLGLSTHPGSDSFARLLEIMGVEDVAPLDRGGESVAALGSLGGCDWVVEFGVDAPHQSAGAARDAAPLDFDALEGHEFERYCAGLLSRSGFSDVEVTQGSGDQGIDVIAWRDGIKYGFQCKRYSSDVGNKAVQEAYAGKAYYKCHVAIVLTNQHFTQSAVDLAKRNGVVLWDRRRLLELAREAH